MSDFLRGLLGVAQGAGQGYFRGQAMKAEQAEAEERLAMARERERLAQEDQDFQRQDRERQAQARAATESQRIRDEFRRVSMGARHGGMLRGLMTNPNDKTLREQLLLENPKMLGDFDQEQKRQAPPAAPKPPWEREGFGEGDAGRKAMLGWTRERAQAGWRDRVGSGGGGAPAPRVSEQNEEIQGQAILRQMKGQPPEVQRRFAESFSQAFTPDVPPGRIAFRVWQSLQDMSLPRGVMAGMAPETEAAEVDDAVYQRFYQEALGRRMSPRDAAAYARQKAGQ